ncbi:hypothetical protein Ancab_005079 [Ancistrocladus abbreviatus]
MYCINQHQGLRIFINFQAWKLWNEGNIIVSVDACKWGYCLCKNSIVSTTQVSMANAIASRPLALCLLLLCCMILWQFCVTVATDTIVASQVLSVGQTLVSAGQIFELGFFTPVNSSKRYIGIWYKNISPRTIVWVANRESSLAVTDNSAILTIGKDGNLRLLDGKQSTIWSTNISTQVNSSSAVLSNTGDLILQDTVSGGTLWESFQDPCNVLLNTNMMLGVNTKTGEKRSLTSWKSEDDPSPGNFTGGLLPQTPVQAFVWKGSAIHWRSGPWNGVKFVGVEGPDAEFTNIFAIQQNNQVGTVYLTFIAYSNSSVYMMRLLPSGSLEFLLWEQSGQLNVTWVAPASACEVYGTCGPFGVCNSHEFPICKCPKGFVPKSNEEWSKGSWSSGCVRRTELLCQKNVSGNLGSGREEIDGFLTLNGMKLPDGYHYLYSKDVEACQNWCLDNCSCTAYAYVNGIDCLVWIGELKDMQKFMISGEDLFVKLAHSELVKKKRRAALIISLTAGTIMIIFICIMYIKCKQKAKQIVGFMLRPSLKKSSSASYSFRDGKSKFRLDELPLFKLEKLAIATNDFEECNKLGQGGFGPVYKGRLEDGQEIAVKRLSKFSGQGVDEFMNEVGVISKLQHRNLVRLLGCCIDGEEKMLVYEYMPNKSLDAILFDPSKKQLLHWNKRFGIIEGICRGLLYLHRDSRLKIIHRDLKASNILLDENLNPKISDFGMARIFQGNQDYVNTRRVVGTYGYMSPEYALEGHFSEKSDIFSFGVLLIEIVSGIRNSSFGYNEDSLSLLAYAWKLWNEGNIISIIDTTILDPCFHPEILRCIHVGLLCVQEHPIDRPNICTLISMLGGEITNLSQPKQPGFTRRHITLDSGTTQLCQQQSGSINYVSITDLGGR